MKVVAEQEPERPSLRHRLEGENKPNRSRPNCGKEIREEPRRCNKAVKNHATKPRRAAQQSRARKPRRKDASRSTDFATTHNTSWNTDSAMSMRIDTRQSGVWILSETDPTWAWGGMLRIKLKCGLVCELTLRVNRHSKGQESPLSQHYVF